MPIAVVVLAAELHLAWVYRAAFAPLFRRNARRDPGSGSAAGRGGPGRA